MKKVLIVEDEPHIRLLLRELLATGDFQVEEAADGREALQKIRAFSPDLIIVDLIMPNLNGLALFREIRSDSTLMNMKVILLTGNPLASLDKEMAAGVDLYIGKPFSPKQLLESIHRVLKND